MKMLRNYNYLKKLLILLLIKIKNFFIANFFKKKLLRNKFIYLYC
jgi:hypothetical protein